MFVGVVITVYYYWGKNNEAEALAAVQSPNGFAPIIMPSGAQPGTVWILAPANCPSDAARRAESLAAGLRDKGIPVVKSARGSGSTVTNPTKEQHAALRRSVAILQGEIPAVFINGLGKANPTLDEVVAEYQRVSTQP